MVPATRDPSTGGEPSGMLWARWARIGGHSAVAPSAGMVDVERLLVATAAHGEESLLQVAASWLAVHHMLVFGRRLAGMAGALANSRQPMAASLGALLARAWTGALALPRELRLRPEGLEIARDRCGAHDAGDASGSAAKARWKEEPPGSRGVSSELVRPIEWIVRHVPELRVRALIGATLEAEIMIAALAHHRPPAADVPDVPRPSVGAVAHHAGVSYAGVHGAANRLVRRGLLEKHVVRGQVVLRPTMMACVAFHWPEHVVNCS